MGATFDESLDGIIRVSVVATGVDQPAAARPAQPTESRIAELAKRLKIDTQRLADRLERSDPPQPGRTCRRPGDAGGAVIRGERGRDQFGCDRSGCGRSAVSERDRRGDHSADPAQALVVYRADRG